MNASLLEAEVPEGNFSLRKLYKKVLNPEDRRRTSVRISTGTEVRLGGTYLMHVELSRREIAQLFFETHNGSMVRMFKAFIEEEETEERAEILRRIAEMDERRRQRKIDTESEIAP
ncbi:hypothetical protein QCM77_29660 [Bradyrhizobium sp. SSUT18]|uniref:hypothetical protein n=1 Tax=Bradyrhizobium sp. SSUT18 TaxID=3040602 RepID=UPI00244D0587|nr:hypothetical protein [Bradyrhizobium sp. SSUT18]MDH2404089.1 hypothetical protein [Bradyrhizobium sp. SSUT18]